MHSPEGFFTLQYTSRVILSDAASQLYETYLVSHIHPTLLPLLVQTCLQGLPQRLQLQLHAVLLHFLLPGIQLAVTNMTCVLLLVVSSCSPA